LTACVYRYHGEQEDDASEIPRGKDTILEEFSSDRILYVSPMNSGSVEGLLDKPFALYL
jgi:hypothetical protein